MNRTTSLTGAKAHLAKLVDAAEYRGERIVFVRNGRPAAAIVPVRRQKRGRHPYFATDVDALASLRRFVAPIGSCDPDVSAVDDLLAGRR